MILALMFIVGFSPHVMAADVELEAVLDAVASLEEQGVPVRDDFIPDENLDPADFVNMLTAAYWGDLDLPEDFDGRLNKLVMLGYITEPEKRRMVEDKAVNYIMAWRITLTASGEWPRPVEYFPDTKPQDQVMGVYEDARATAMAMGLADGSEASIYRMPLGMFAVFLNRLLTGEYTELPDFFGNLYESGLIDMTTADRRPVFSRAWAGYWAAVCMLPEHLLQQFGSSGWKVTFRSKTVDGSRRVEGGMCHYSDRLIYLHRVDERGVLHEFGHYFAQAGGYRARLTALFETEGPNMEKYLRSYSYTNASEYFADCFAFWFMSDDGPEILKKYSSGVYAIISEIVQLPEGETAAAGGTAA